MSSESAPERDPGARAQTPEQEIEAKRQHIRQQMLDNLNRAALASDPAALADEDPEQA